MEIIEFKVPDEAHAILAHKRYEIAKGVFATVLANSTRNHPIDEIAKFAVTCADALLKELSL